MEVSSSEIHDVHHVIWLALVAPLSNDRGSIWVCLYAPTRKAFRAAFQSSALILFHHVVTVWKCFFIRPQKDISSGLNQL